MYQVVARRDDKEGYKVVLTDLPDGCPDPIVFLPEISTKSEKHLKYVSKYTHETGNIIIKLVRSDGEDPFGRPKALAHSLFISPEEYNFNVLNYYASPLFTTNIFDSINEEPQILTNKAFKKEKISILDEIDLKVLRELVVSSMIEEHLVIMPKLKTSSLIELASVIDKAVPYEASYDFSLISYSDKRCQNQLVHNFLYFYNKDEEESIGNTIKVKNVSKSVRKIAVDEKDYLDDYIEMILKEDYEKLVEEHAKWVIGMYYNEHKELQQKFTRRYQLDIPFSRRNKFQAKLTQSLKKIMDTNNH